MADAREQDADDSDPEAPASESKSADEEIDESRMSFVQHLTELRLRIRNSVIAILAAFVVTYTFSEEILLILLKPLIEAMIRNDLKPELNFGAMLDPFWGYFSLALWAGFFVAAPFVFYQLWKFIAPGLYQKERRVGVAFACCSTVFFIGGAVFCYFLVLPAVYDFLLGYAKEDMSQISHMFGIELEVGEDISLKPVLMIREYIAFSRKLLIGFGIVFELPLLVFFLSIVGVVTHRGMWRFNRWWIVCSFAISAMLTPPDVMSQILMAGPLVVLYNLSIIVSFIITKRRERKAAKLDAGMADP